MKRLLVIPAYFGVLLLALFGSPAIANHSNDPHENMRHVANRGEGEDDRTFTDLAFWGRIAAQGTYDGFRLFDISNPASPKELVDYPCNGGQGDVSLHKAGNRLLLFRSIDSAQNKPECDSTGVSTALQPTTPTLFEGIRIIDVTNPAKPKFVKGVYTDCGSHTHTLIRDNKNNRAIIYVSSYPIGAQYDFDPAEEFGPSKQCKVPHARISVIVVPNGAPEKARVHHEHPIHPQAVGSGGLGEALPGTIGCHDITVFTDPKVKAAASACLTEAQLWDISNPLYPCTVPAPTPQAPRNQGEDCHTHIDVPNVELYHSSTYTWDARVVLFGDEHGGGLAPGCNGPEDTQGNIWFHKNVKPGNPSPVLGRYMIERVVNPQPCTLHNFNIIPIENNRRYIGVSSLYQGGTTVFDFTGVKKLLANPPIATDEIVANEIAWWDSEGGDGNGRADDWSTYWHNNFIYASGGLGALRDVPAHRAGNRGLDVYTLLVNGKRFRADTEPYQNPQTQEDLEENERRRRQRDRERERDDD
ncbi:MAG: hypothetical protein M3N24_01510 [Actinomycetota bacterium]|nr:hypothetical protein [Actinomycetota bacterium]